MAYKIIDDETALVIYEAVQENATRSFGQYNRLRQLPRTKINGEIAFYLDALLDFSTKVLGREPEETLQDVVDAGVISWFANLDPSLQQKVGFSLSEEEGAPVTVPSSDESLDADENRDTIESLSRKVAALESALESVRSENARLAEVNETLESDKASLQREMVHLQRSNDELMEKTLAEEVQAIKGPAFLGDDAMGSVYTEMTTHMLTSPSQGEKSKPAASKKKNQKKKKRG